MSPSQVLRVSALLLLAACDPKDKSQTAIPKEPGQLLAKVNLPQRNFKQDWLGTKLDGRQILSEVTSNPDRGNYTNTYNFNVPPSMDVIKAAVADIRSLSYDLQRVGPLVAEFVNKNNSRLTLQTGDPLNDSQKIVRGMLGDPEYSAKLREAYRGQSLECFALASVYSAAASMLDRNRDLGTISLIGGIFYGTTLDGRDYSKEGIAHAWVLIEKPDGSRIDLCPSLSASDKPVTLHSAGTNRNALPIVGISVNKRPRQTISIFLSKDSQ